MTAQQWFWNRSREYSSWVGLALITIGNWGLLSSDPSVQEFLHIFNEYSPQVGAFLVAASTRHP